MEKSTDASLLSCEEGREDGEDTMVFRETATLSEERTEVAGDRGNDTNCEEV